MMHRTFRLLRPRILPRTPPSPITATVNSRRTLLTTSYTKGSTELPLLQETIPQHFAAVVSKFGDRTAVISRAQQKRLTYAELDRWSNAVANGLRALGVVKGDRVAVSLGNNVEFAVTTYALSKLGAVLVPLNPAFTSLQVISALSHLTVSHLIIGTETNLPFKKPRENLSLLNQILLDPKSHTLKSELVPSLKNIILVDNASGRVKADLTATTPFSELLLSSTEAVAFLGEQPHPDDIVNIQFTSGTTSTPKAACLTHTNILNNGFFIGERMLLSEKDIVCCPPPLFHCFGCILGYMATATHGAAIVFPSEAFEPKAVLLSIQEEHATALYGVATMFVAELELLQNGSIKQQGFEHLRTGIAAGSSVPATLMKKLHEKLNLTQLTICYGMTETSPVSCMTKPDDPLIKRCDSVGQALDHVEVKIVDKNDPNITLPIGQRGELCVAGYSLMKEYWGDPVKTAEVMVTDADSKVWMLSGDEAEMDEDGFVRITGRIKDLIIRGGENIHPLEVENILFAHEMIAEASVVGLPDERLGECVAAFIIVHEGVKTDEDDAGRKVGGKSEKLLRKEEVREWVRNNLSGHLVPKYVFFVQDYPKTPSGKIQKFVLRDEGIRLLKNTA